MKSFLKFIAVAAAINVCVIANSSAQTFALTSPLTQVTGAINNLGLPIDLLGQPVSTVTGLLSAVPINDVLSLAGSGAGLVTQVLSGLTGPLDNMLPAAPALPKLLAVPNIALLEQLPSVGSLTAPLSGGGFDLPALLIPGLGGGLPFDFLTLLPL